MNQLRPSTTAGPPGSVAPTTSTSPAERCARYQIDGRRVPRCGSLASSGLPVAVSAPSTTQLFEPSASVVPPSSRLATAELPPDKPRANAADQVSGPLY